MTLPDLDTTELLQRVTHGDKLAEAELMPRVYRELHRIATSYLRRERKDHTLQPTALVNEAYLRLISKPDLPWKDRSHFFGVAARAMRRILVDYARQRDTAKRSGIKLPLEDGLAVSDEQCELVQEMDQALERLAQLHPRQAQVVELRFFAGLNEEECAEVMRISSRTVKRDWVMARAWLYGELSPRSK